MKLASPHIFAAFGIIVSSGPLHAANHTIAVGKGVGRTEVVSPQPLTYTCPGNSRSFGCYGATGISSLKASLIADEGYSSLFIRQITVEVNDLVTVSSTGRNGQQGLANLSFYLDGIVDFTKVTPTFRDYVGTLGWAWIYAGGESQFFSFDSDKLRQSNLIAFPDFKWKFTYGQPTYLAYGLELNLFAGTADFSNTALLTDIGVFDANSSAVDFTAVNSSGVDYKALAAKNLKSISNVPEPEIWGQFIFGFAIVGGLSRIRRSTIRA